MDGTQVYLFGNLIFITERACEIYHQIYDDLFVEFE